MTLKEEFTDLAGPVLWTLAVIGTAAVLFALAWALTPRGGVGELCNRDGTCSGQLTCVQFGTDSHRCRVRP